ncbi:hypothetical protein PRIC2_014572 [Phytophthora ramorum]
MPFSKNGVRMPTLELERHDEEMMQELAATLLQQNLDQYSEMAVTPDGHPDSRSWASIQKREGIRVYKESTRQQQQQIRSQAATGNSAVKTAKVPPSLLLMGTIKGNLDDVCACSHRRAYNGRPMHFLNVTWRYYALSEPRDYVCLDVAGWGTTSRGEQVAYHLIHSVGFDALPNYEHKGVARVNMSVCWIFRQRTASLVECYARGYYDFDTTNAMLNSISMHTIASQWLSCAKLVSESDSGDGGGFRGNNNYDPSQSQTMSSSTSSSGNSVVLLPIPPGPARVPASRCKLCCKSFRFLGASRRLCQACDDDVCSRCSVKETLVLFSRARRCVRERKKNFCKQCVADAARSEASAVARDDFVAAAQAPINW